MGTVAVPAAARYEDGKKLEYLTPAVAASCGLTYMPNAKEKLGQKRRVALAHLSQIVLVSVDVIQFSI